MRIISKVSTFTVSQYVSKNNEKPIGRIKFFFRLILPMGII